MHDVTIDAPLDRTVSSAQDWKSRHR